MSATTATVFGIVVGIAAVICGISRIVFYFREGVVRTGTMGPGGPISYFTTGALTGPGVGRGGLLILVGIGLITIHLSWFWPSATDEHETSLALSLVTCVVGLFFITYWQPGDGPPMIELYEGRPGLGVIMVGAGNALIQLSFIWDRLSGLSYLGLAVVILGLFVLTYILLIYEWSVGTY